MPSAPVRPEALLEHAAWLRGLAASLVRGDADADDLVQETWLAALRRPPLDDRPVRGWLTEVVRNAGRMRGRAAGRRAVREAAAGAGAETSAPSADELLGRLEAQRMLARLVAELDEPFRGAVLLRYFEGLSSAEIARHQGVPAGTVRWRLKTGLDRLRAALDRENDGERGRWTALLGPLSLPAHKGLHVASVLKGVWVMSRIAKIGTVVAALVMLVGAGAWWRARRAHAVGPVAAATARPEAKRGPRRPAAPPRAAPMTMTAATMERDPSAVHGAFEGRVVNWSSGEGVKGAEVLFSSGNQTSLAHTDAAGRFQIVPPSEGRCVIDLVTATGYLPFAPEFGHSPFELFARAGTRVKDLTIYLTPALDYTGLVLDPDEHPVPGALVTLLGAGEGEQALHPLENSFTADDKGEFVFHAPDGALLEARHPSFDPGRARFDGTAATSHHLTIHLHANAGAAELGREKIAGRVIDGSGAPVLAALVRATPLDSAPDALHPTAQTLSDAAGHFTIYGLDPGRHRVIAALHGYAPATTDAVLAGDADLVLALHAGGALTGRVTGGAGSAPVPSFTIAVTRRDGPVKEVSVSVRSVVDPEGRFTVPDLEPGDYRVRASALTQAPSPPVDATVPDPPASAAPLEIALTRGGTLVGKVVEAGSGAPLAHARVSMESMLDTSSTVPIVASALTSDTGDFSLEGVSPGVRSVTVAAYQHNIRILSGMRFDDGATVGPVTVALAATEDGEEPHIERRPARRG
jgi:RNA polymerase sigma factor (sigma-70 family)